MSGVQDLIDPQPAEALAAIPETSAGIFDLSDIHGTRLAIHAMADAANAAGLHEAGIVVEVHAASRPDGPDLQSYRRPSRRSRPSVRSKRRERADDRSPRRIEAGLSGVLPSMSACR